MTGPRLTSIPNPLVQNSNTSAAPAAQTGAVVQGVGANSTAVRFELDAYASTGFYSTVRRDGTAASPSQVQAGEQIGGFNGMGYTDGGAVSGPIASYRVYALENQTSSNQGGIASIATCASGSTTLTDRVNVYGGVGVGIGLASATTVPTGGLEIGTSGAASFSGLRFSGALFTGGTTTTTFPLELMQPSGTSAVTTWSTSGTGLGMNLASGFAGNFLDFHVAGGASLFRVSSAGSVISAASIQAGNTGLLGSAGRGNFAFSADGVFTAQNNAATGFTRFNFGGTTSSFPSLKVSSATLQGRLADDSAFTFVQAKLQTDAAATTSLTPGALAATTNASIVLYDSTGQAYRVPCII